MSLYYYKGKNFAGSKTIGMVEAESDYAVAKKIKNDGYIPVKIKSIDKNSFIYILAALFNRITFFELAIFCRHLAIMLDSGVGIVESLSSIAKQTKNSKLHKIIMNISRQVERGSSLSDSCKNYPYAFSDVFISAIEAGEISGNLSEALQLLSEYYSSNSKQSEKIKNALTYPAILGVASIGTIIFLSTKVLPVYANIFSSAGVQLPRVTRILISVSSNMVEFCLGILIFLSSIFFITLQSKKSFSIACRIDELKLSIPLIGKFIKNETSAQVIKLLNILVSSGIPILKALEISMGTVKNQFIKKELYAVWEGLKQGKNLAGLMPDNIFSPLALEMIFIGEESGNLAEMLDKAASFYEEEVKILSDKITVLIEPVMIIFMTILVSFIVISVVIPMFDVYNLF
ncbi:type II secretion system F family protein [Tepidanaerobacter syntrophicus]|uniref:type II secretion system F family protein n=1 Tax=Tepidanaerobacter syntrophicus TaxID=224999 RepID=UPI00235B5CFC|nr:type II secretion system F family protein [Tepidanaerobacter syntrophicus]